MKRIFACVLMVSMLIFCLAACSATAAEVEDKPETEIAVEVMTASRETLCIISEITGKVAAGQEVAVYAKVSAEVEALSVSVGDKVEKNDMLFVLSKDDINNAYNSAKAAYNTAQASYNVTMDRYELAKNQYNAMEVLYEQGGVSKTQLDEAKNAVSSASVSLAEAQLEQARVGLQSASESLDNAEAHAPISGTVSSVNLVEGGMASPAMAAVTIVDMDTVYINVEVPETMVNKIKPGESVSVNIAAVSDTLLTAIVDTVSPVASQQTQLYGIKVALENGDGQIKPGMFASIIFETDELKDVLTVPTSSVVLKDGRYVVYAVENGRAALTAVETGANTGTVIEIKSGLSEGALIICKGQSYVEDQSLIKIVGGAE